MRLASFVGATLIALAGCGKPSEPPRVRNEAGAPRAAPQPVTPVLHQGVPWYEDATAEALAEAKSQGKLVLVDLWAPWCHTCLSMREYVLTSANLAGLLERFVFLAANTERVENAPLLRALPISAWPTFYVIDADRAVYGRWVGAASPQQLGTFLRDALKAHVSRGAEAHPADAPLALLVAADRALAKEQLAQARDHYRRALATAPANWPRRPDALVALASTLDKLEQPGACVALGLRSMDQTGDSASATDFSYHVLECAKQLDADDARARTLRQKAERRLADLCEDGSPALAPDDRGDACGLLHELREQRDDAEGARAALSTRLALLDGAADGLPDRVAMTYDAARAESLLGLGRGEDAIDLLRAREEAVPDDYNPPQQLARIYRELARYTEGLEAVERALAKTDGPRRAGILGLKADLLLGAGRKPEARRALEQQLAAYRALPVGQQQPARETKLAERLAHWK